MISILTILMTLCGMASAMAIASAWVAVFNLDHPALRDQAADVMVTAILFVFLFGGIYAGFVL